MSVSHGVHPALRRDYCVSMVAAVDSNVSVLFRVDTAGKSRGSMGALGAVYVFLLETKIACRCEGEREWVFLWVLTLW